MWSLCEENPKTDKTYANHCNSWCRRRPKEYRSVERGVAEPVRGGYVHADHVKATEALMPEITVSGIRVDGAVICQNCTDLYINICAVDDALVVGCFVVSLACMPSPSHENYSKGILK